MKNEVNRTFTVKKNKFTNFLSCFYANTPQNLGGGNSHSSTVVTPVWKGSRPTVSRRSTDSQNQDHRNHTPISKALKYAAVLLAVFVVGIGNAWGATTLFSTNFSTTDGWSNENLTTSSQTETTKTIKGTTITIHGYKSASAKVSSANTTSGTFTFTSNNISPSEDVSASNINYYMAIPVSGIVGGAVTVTITTSSAYKPYYIYRDGLTGDFSDRLQAAVNNTFTITDLTNTSAIIYLGTSGKTMTSLTITTPQLTDLTASAFYQLYANAEKTYDKLIEDASFPSYISTNIAAVSSESGNSSLVATPHDFTALGSGTYYRLKTANNNKIELEALSHVKSIRLYGNGNGSSRTVTVTASKISGTGTAPTISSMSMVNSKKTVVEYTTGDLTALTGYNVNTYYTYTLAFPGAADIWGIYVEYAAPSCSAPAAPTITGTDSYKEGETITLTGTSSDAVSTTTYAWYEGTDWATASAADPVQTAATAVAGGNVFSKTAALSDNGKKYWCLAANSTCTSHNETGFEISVAAAPVANPTISSAVNEAGWGSVSDGNEGTSITVTSGSTISISSNVLTCDAKTLTATATAATAEYTYAFVNWTGVTNGAEVTTNVTATANFSRTANNYTLAWDKNAEDADALAGDYTSGTVAYGSEITKPNTPTRDGYDFVGWAESSSGDVVEVPATMPAANKTYYAKWAADPCSEPDKVTNEIARFFVPCGLSNSKGDGSAWTVSDEEASTEDNTFNTYKFGGTASSNWYRNTTSGLIYGKLTDNAGYIQIKLKNDKPFKAGDVVYVYCNRDKESKSSVKLHDQSTGNEVTLSSTAAGVEASGSYTLVAADVESDGSLKFFRSSSNTFVNRIIVTREPPCVGDPGDISKGTLSAGVLTLNAAGSPVSGDTWYWQTSATGTDQTNSGTSYGVSAAGTYYVRSYNATGTCWSDAKSFTVTAEDLVENYTVIYKDGTTELKSVTVTVGNAPDAYSPTKDFYTFAAWQKDAADFDPSGLATSAVNGDEITLTARWAGNYAYGTYLFNSLTMGSTISKTITDKEVVYNDAFRVDNFYFAAEIKIQGEIGTAEETTTLTNYKGWKLKTDAKTIKFLVENNSQVKVAIGEKTGIQVTYTPLVGAETTVAQAKDNETAYSVKGGTVVTITTTSDNTTTLKRLSISNLYNVTYTDGTGDASGSASNVPEVTLPTPIETIVTVESTDYSFTGWKANQAVTVNDVVKSAGTLLNAGDVAVLGANTTFTAQWAVVTPKYAITKGTHTNGDFTISVAEQEAGGAVTLTATPNEDYVFSAWAVVKTEDGSATGITVSNNTFTMPAYGVTVNATFAADPRSKVLYVTSNTADATKSDDKVYAALKDTYNVKIVGPTSDADQSSYALVVLHESLNGGNDYNATAVAAAKTGITPVLNTKAYFYNSGRWAWGTPNAGKKTKGVHVNTSYCNITDHPLFNDLTPDANDSIIILSAINDDGKPIQPVGSFTSGKEGYTLANVPDGCAIHELTPAQRGASSGKYLLISLYSKDFGNLNANGQKLFQNAAAYLIGNTAWEPINALTSPAVAASPSAAYSVGDNIALTASATGSSAATTYTWYKGDTWAAAEEAGAIKDAATAAAGGNTYGITGCALDDAGTYWCVISNGTGCEVSASLAVTVSDVSYDIAFVSAHGTAPTATTGVSYTLPELTASGWEHQGWTANINVTVDAATVDAGDLIANGKIATFGANVTFTAVWEQVFDVTFNMQSHGASISAQHIVNGGKATEPNEPSAIGWVFGGWFTDADCTEGNEFDFDETITADVELFAKWTAFDGCVELWPATSGDAPAVGDEINMQSGSKGATMTVLAIESGSFAYTSSGLQFGSNAGPKVRVVLNNEMSASAGTKISVTLVAGGTNTRGLNLYDANGNKIDAFTCWVKDVNPATNGAEETFTYTVVENDGLDGANEFQLARNNTVYLKALKVSSCGDEIIYHDLTSEVNIAGKGTVALGATSVREGYTTTATYSDIDPLYEFVSWSVSGEGASIEDASANPATITMGTEDAVVTLNLQLIPVRYTVTYMDGESTLGTEDVDENGHPTASEITTAKEGYIFEGWYNDAELISGPVTLSSVTITAAKTFYGKWVSDGKIRLIANGALNTTDFVTGGTLQNASYTVEGTIYAKNVQLGNTCSNVTSIDNTNKAIFYHSQSDETKVTIVAYDNYTGGTTAQLHYAVVPEGTTSASMTTETMNKSTGGVYEVNMTGRSTLYICVGKTEVRICQIVVEEKGKANKVAPEVGYSVNLNKQRPFLAKEAATVFEGIEYYVSSAYKPLNAQVQIKTTGTHYVSFTIPAGEARQLQLTTSSTSKYAVSQTKGDVTTLITPVANKAQTFNLGEGTWYINPNGSNVSITSIAFDAPQYDLNDDTNVSAILPGADVTVNNGVSLNVDVEKTIHDLTISSKAGASGQITGTVTNLTIAGDLYMDVRFFEGAETLNETTAGRWYMISAPFDVNLNGGFSLTNGTPMTFGQTDGENIFDLFEYDGNKRATTGVTGWKRVQGKMNAGRACLIGFNPGQPTTIRLKAASTVLSEPTSITLNAYDGDEANRNWNGVANPTMHYTDLNKDVQTYNNEDGENGRKYIAYSASSTSFVVGTAFFVQETGTIDLSAASHSEFRAPQRQANERYEACVRIFRQEATDFADQMYVRASENASSEYEQGHDMITWNGTTANTALIWANNYGKRLAIEEAPMVNKKASYKLGIFAPIAGEYRIEAANPNDDATLYLTKNGRIFWNLTMGACELDLAQGQNNEYGLLLRAEAPAVTTGIDEVRSEAGVQKIIIDENVFILRGEQLFDMTGKLVK